MTGPSASPHMTQKSERGAQKNDEEQPRLQEQRHTFDDRDPPSEMNQLAPNEIWWSQHFGWLKDRGYLLRPRYAPGWVPSWRGTKKDRLLCEDSKIPVVSVLESTASY